MSNPKDIDAHRDAHADEEAGHLLLDLLYGELEGEARGQAERRVRDDAALAQELEGWERVRTLMRELPEEEPPDSLSVKLLHAAAAHHARAEQAEGRTLWGWLKSLFMPVMMYPGLAAATSLVLVAGIAGTLYLSGRTSRSELMREPRAPVFAPGMQETAEGSRMAAAPMDQDESGERYGAEEQAVVADDDAEADLALGGVAQGQNGWGDGQNVASGRGGFGSGAGAGLETERKESRSRSSASPSQVTLAREAGKKDESAGFAYDTRAKRQAPAGRAYEGGALDDVLRDEAQAGSAGKGGSVRSAEPAPPPPPAAAPASPRREGVVGGSGTAGPTGGAPAAAPAEDSAAEASAPAPRKSKAAVAPADSSRDKDDGVRARIVSLHRKALSAAENKDCGVVVDVARQVRALDAEFYQKSFLGDARLRVCLGDEKATKK